jgi:hypothetical protein
MPIPVIAIGIYSNKIAFFFSLSFISVLLLALFSVAIILYYQIKDNSMLLTNQALFLFMQAKIKTIARKVLYHKAHANRFVNLPFALLR